MDKIIEQIFSDVLQGRHKEIIPKVKSALRLGIPPSIILHDSMIAAMQEVGRLFEVGDYYVPEMLVAARAMQSGLKVLKPHLLINETNPTGKVVIGTVQGDFHDIGKNLVKMMLEGSGFEVIDLGVDVSPDAFLSEIMKQPVDILALSALITTTMQNMQPVIDSLVESGLRKKVKILVGGAPLTEKFARQIGADGYAPDASRAVTVAKLLLSK